MKVIVDTGVWSLTLRNKKRNNQKNGKTLSQDTVYPEVILLQELIEDGRIVLIGVVRQELLSEIR